MRNPLRKSGSYKPTLEQWVNRFIEYTDDPMQSAIRFGELLEAGLSEDEAFKIAVTVCPIPEEIDNVD